MNWAVVRLLYGHELRMLVRARRTMVMAVVIPAVIMPVMLFASKYASDQRQLALEKTTYTYAITGRLADRVRDLIDQARTAIGHDKSDSGEQLRQFHFSEVPIDDPVVSLEQHNIHFYIQTLTGEEADANPLPKDSSDDGSPASAEPEPRRLKGVPVVRVVYRGNDDTSSTGSQRMQSLLLFALRADTDAILIRRGFQGNPKQLFAIDAASIATAAQVTGSNIGKYITVFLVMLMLTGGSIAAMDIIAGEKERGTIETLLTTAAGRTEIVTAKQMAICSVALAITLIQAVNFLVYVRLKLVQLPRNFALNVPLSNVLTLLLLFIPLAATVAAVLLMISAYAKTYKEAQMYFFPVYLASFVPSLAAVLPGIHLRSAIVLVPVANVSVAVHEIMMNRIDRPMIGITFAVMTFTAVMLMRASARMLTREDIIVSAHTEPEAFLGGPPLFRKRVLRWYLVMWALIFTAAANVPQLATFRAQIFFNEFVIFGGAGILMIRVYRLDVRKALSLRSVKWPVWIAVILAAPAGNVMGVALFKLLSHVLPVSDAMMEQMGALIPKDVPMWQLYLLIGPLPAIIEELSFRGLLLYGLRRKVRPVLLPLVVGIIFGLFHFTLFRIGPVAFLGVLLTVVAMLTGSVFPGMVLHALNNSFALWAGEHAWPLDSLAWWHYVAATVIFALAMWIIYRNRTPVLQGAIAADGADSADGPR